MFLFFGCSRLQSYSVEVENMTRDYGLLLIDFSVKPGSTSKSGKRQKVYKLYPRRNTGGRGGKKLFGAFNSTYHELPKEIYIKWQLADLSDCDKKFNKYGCTFHPIEEKIFQKTIDLRSYQKTDVFQDLGKISSRGWPSRNTATLKIEFNGDDFDISVHSGSTKVWQ